MNFAFFFEIAFMVIAVVKASMGQYGILDKTFRDQLLAPIFERTMKQIGDEQIESERERKLI